MVRRRQTANSDRIDRNYYNLNTFCLNWGTEFTGGYDMPVLGRSNAVPDNLFPYEEQSKWKRSEDGAIHFYCEDSHFESVWLRANRFPHVPAVVQKAKVALTPDFSLFTDWPIAIQIWNVYRARLIGAIWQQRGIDVIPSVSWGTPDSYDFCFEGLPVGGTIAVATTYVSESEEKELFVQGFETMLDVCQPETVLVYGRGLKGKLEELHPQIKRFDSRIAQITRARQQARQETAQ